MVKILEIIKFWFNVARGYTIPLAIMSWLIPFVFALVVGGNIAYGLLALFGILIVQMGVNMLDDVIDFLIAMKTYKPADISDLKNYLQDGKCRFILDNQVTVTQTFLVAMGLFTVALLIGVYLTIKCGLIVAVIVLITSILCILYPILTYVGLGELIVGFIFAPMLYLGTYYVMTQSFSFEIIIISISTGLLTVGVLHTHTFMDYDFDVSNKKKTLCSISGSKENAARLQGIIMLLAYINILMGVIFNFIPKTMLLILLAIPTAVSLYKVLFIHINNPRAPIERTFWMGPMENWSEIVKNNLQDFMLKFLLARNVMMIFTLLVCVSKIIDEFIK